MPNASGEESGVGTATLWFAISLLGFAVFGGGGQGGLGDSVAQLLAIGLLANLLWLGANGRISWRAAAWVMCLPVLALALPLLQLLPIPMSWWSAAPARAELAAQLAQAGVTPIGVVSLNPSATEQAFQWLLPATALFLATLALSRTSHRWLLGSIVVLAALSTLLGLAQLADGSDSPLRFYSNTNRADAVGFFANRNHLATLLAMALPVALAGTGWALSERFEGRKSPAMTILAGIGAVILLILGIALTRSRAGMLLGMLAVLGSLPMIMGLDPRRGAKRIIAVALTVALVLSVQFALLGALDRLASDPLDDERWKFAQTTRQAAAAYAPLGSGLGTFRQAYQPFEAMGQPGTAIVNHAHNDYLELWLEGGIPALILLGLGMLIWCWQGVRLWRLVPAPGTSEALARLLARAAWLSASLALLHSALDYPLRTTANLAVFAVLAAIAFTEPARRRRRAG